MLVEYAFSTRKRGKLRPFHSEKLGADLMPSTLPGRNRDLANPLAFEPLSLKTRETATISIEKTGGRGLAPIGN